MEYEYISGYTDRGTTLKKLQNEVVFRENASKFIVDEENPSQLGISRIYFKDPKDNNGYVLAIGDDIE